MSSSENFSLNEPTNKCLRCGYQWQSNRIAGQPALIEPCRCARCRSPLWNTPRRNKQPSKELKEKIFQLECDRDGWENLYRSEHRRRLELEAEVARLNKIIEGNNEVIEGQFADLCVAQRTIKQLRKF